MKEKRHSDVVLVILNFRINLTGHINLVHEGRKPIKCDLFDASFSQKSDLNRHIAAVHEGKKHSNVKFAMLILLQN